MPHYLITREDPSGSGKRLHATAAPFFVGRYSLMFMLLFFIGVLSVIYLVHFNGVATKGYEIARLDYERGELLDQKEQKNMRLSETQTLEFVRQSSVTVRMHMPANVEYYWPVRDGEVALVD